MELPLTGLRVIDLTVVWAGNGVTMLLADLGAEVIKVESIHHFPPNTRGNDPRTYNESRPAGYRDLRYPDRDPGHRPFDRAAQFNGHSTRKLGCTMDLDTPLGRSAFLRLVARSDVLVENNSPRVLRNLGLEYPTLAAVNPRLVMVRMPGMGLDGPYSEFLGFGANFNSLAGITVLSGYAGAGPETAGANYHMDEATPPSGAFAVLAALVDRERTGEGQLIEVAQAENLLLAVGEHLLDAQSGGQARPPALGNAGEEVVQGCVSVAGVDRRLVISLRDDRDWAALLEVVGCPEWTADVRFADHAARLAHQAELFQLLAELTSTTDREVLFHRLQAAGIPAGPVLSEHEVLTDPHVAERGFFRELHHPEAGTHRYPTFPWRSAELELAWGRPAPSLGEHNEHVYREVLGYTADEYAEFVAAGMIGCDYELGG